MFLFIFLREDFQAQKGKEVKEYKYYSLRCKNYNGRDYEEVKSIVQYVVIVLL